MKSQLLAVVTAITLSAGCDKLFSGNSPTSPSGENQAVQFLADPDARFVGVHPAPVLVNGKIYVYANTNLDGVSVQGSSDGLAFSPTPASYPAGITRTIVTLPDGRFRMYYLATGSSSDVLSAISSDGLRWTVESGIRYTQPAAAAIRAVSLPTGGYRLYYPTNSGNLDSAVSGDGLTFTSEGQVGLPPVDATYTWGASAAAYLGSQCHMILTKSPTSGFGQLWHAVSSDGRNWTLDKSAFAAASDMSLNQPAWSITSTIRIYYRAVPQSGSAIASGIFKFQ